MTDDLKKNIARLLTSDDPDERRCAAEELASLNGLASIAALAAALKDENKGVRDAATRALLAIGSANVARAIVEYIGDENIITRNLASELLIRLGAVSVSAILPYLVDPNQDIRKIAVDMLGMIKNEVPVAHLYPRLSDVDQNVVVSTIEALGLIGDPEALPRLFEAYFEKDYARATIAEALGEIGDGRASEFLVINFKKVIETSPFDPVLAFAVIEALGNVGDAHALEVLQHSAEELHGKLLRMLLHASITIAERIQKPLQLPAGAQEALLHALGERDVRVSISAAKGLAGSPDESVTKAFIQALGRSEELDAILFPLIASRPNALSIGASVLEDENLRKTKSMIVLVRTLAAQAIDKMSSSKSFVVDLNILNKMFDAVAQCWVPADEETRNVIVDALFRLDGDRAMAFMDMLCNDPDPWLRIHILEILSQISDLRVPAFIARFLEDEHEMVREVAADVLHARRYPTTGTPCVEN